MRGRMLGNADGQSMIVCFSTCTDSIRTIPALQHDLDRLEDLDTDTEDHAADDWRYACMSRPWIAQPEQQEKPKYESGYRPYRAAEQPGDWRTY
jgi:uncharacterized protein